MSNYDKLKTLIPKKDIGLITYASLSWLKDDLKFYSSIKDESDEQKPDLSVEKTYSYNTMLH